VVCFNTRAFRASVVSELVRLSVAKVAAVIDNAPLAAKVLLNVPVVAATVLGVVAPTVPLMFIDAVPVRFVTVPLLGVPNAPPLTTGAPAVPTLTARAVAMPVPSPETPVLMGRPVQLVRVPLDGVPRTGVTRVGLLESTTLVVPVEVVTPVPPFATGKVPVTPVVSGRPVALVSTAADGVPRFGVVRLGLVANTSAPEPVSSLITPASSAEVVAAKAESLSVVTTKVLEAGTVVPFSVVVLEDERLVKAPVDGLEAPRAVFVRPTAE